MSLVSLQGYKVDKIDFVSKLENGTQIKLGNKYQYNVQYAKDKNICKGEFDFEVHDSQNPDKFKVHVVAIGFFSYEEGNKKELIHAESFKALFPYVKALITTISANCGIKPIIIPQIDIDNQQIYRFDKDSQ